MKRCEDNNLVLNSEKCHFMVNDGFVVGHKIFEKGIEVDQDKIDEISNLPPPISVKGVRSFLGHTGFYRSTILNGEERSILLLQEFDFEVKDQKGSENQVADHLSRLEEASRPVGELEINDALPDERLLAVSCDITPWYAGIANYLVIGLIPDDIRAY
ncbi:uncharacterized protein LOC132601515 [Lycium barbarum]|uniref:uncharacterized protein LOC132601515 n=1 Tax=Lycium barbarum TaxID=112863 RepID=UPI00293EAC9F|nr:uncharacterized protein LOC132601515 [Lycium barbarum]